MNRHLQSIRENTKACMRSFENISELAKHQVVSLFKPNIKTKEDIDKLMMSLTFFISTFVGGLLLGGENAHAQSIAEPTKSEVNKKSNQSVSFLGYRSDIENKYSTTLERIQTLNKNLYKYDQEMTKNRGLSLKDQLDKFGEETMSLVCERDIQKLKRVICQMQLSLESNKLSQGEIDRYKKALNNYGNILDNEFLYSSAEDTFTRTLSNKAAKEECNISSKEILQEIDHQFLNGTLTITEDIDNTIAMTSKNNVLLQKGNAIYGALHILIRHSKIDNYVIKGSSEVYEIPEKGDPLFPEELLPSELFENIKKAVEENEAFQNEKLKRKRRALVGFSLNKYGINKVTVVVGDAKLGSDGKLIAGSIITAYVRSKMR